MAEDFIRCKQQVYLLSIDLNVYSMDALLKTAYWYTDRCYLHLQFSAPDAVEVRFKLKGGPADANVPEQFMNDLLDQTLREKVARETEPLRNLILAHALSKTCLISLERESAETNADPERISVPDHAKLPI